MAGDSAGACRQAGPHRSSLIARICRRAREEHPVDRFIAAYFAKHAITFPAPASDALFARRVYYDLWGLPPTPRQLDAFVRTTRAPASART